MKFDEFSKLLKSNIGFRRYINDTYASKYDKHIGNLNRYILFNSFYDNHSNSDALIAIDALSGAILSKEFYKAYTLSPEEVFVLTNMTDEELKFVSDNIGSIKSEKFLKSKIEELLR